MLKSVATLFILLTGLSTCAHVKGGRMKAIYPSIYFESKSPCDTSYSFSIAGLWPTGTAWDGSALWICGSDFNQIYKYDTLGNILDSIPNPSTNNGTAGLTFDGTHLWALSEELSTVYQLDTADGSVITQFGIPSGGNGFGLVYYESYLYATVYLDSLLFKIDPYTGQILGTYNTEVGIFGLEIIEDVLYGVGTFYDMLFKIDESTGNFIDSVQWCLPFPTGIAWDGNNVWGISSAIQVGGTQKIYKIYHDTSPATHIEEKESPEEYRFSIGPNPFSNQTTISTLSDFREWSLYMYDTKGRLVFSRKTAANKIILDKNGLANGTYLAKLFVEDLLIEQRKLVIGN